MKSNHITTILGISLLFFSCESKSQKKETISNTSVETEKANTSLKPAFEGQTRINKIVSKTAIKHEVINFKLGKPWGIAELPDGSLLVTERSGYMNLVSKDGLTVTKITGFPKVDPSGQGGLLDVILDPNFAENQTIFWTFSEPFEKGNLTTIAKGELSLDKNKVIDVKIVLRATPSYEGRLHYGGRMIFDKDGHLFVGTGERSDKATRPMAQDLTTYLGKIIKITKDGKPAPNNPFLNQKDAKPEIYSLGHRNVQGVAIHPETGELWNSEFGPRGGDEINKVEAGKNYGWPTITYGLEYNGDKIGEHISQKEGLEQPNYYWDPVISPSGMTFYSGKLIEEWKNNLLIATLSGQHIDRLVIENGKVTSEERLLSNEDERFRDVIEAKDGSIFAITDSGKLYKITK